jgi:rubredoxin
MIIIKDGIIPSNIIRFNCENCGCIFEADKGEYQTSTQMEVMHDGLAPYKCQCPRCKRIVYGERTIK